MFRPHNGALRLCARPGCGAAATAELVFQYANATAWVLDLGDPEPASIDLCTRHADRVSAPRGWTTHDRRAGSGPSVSTSVAS
jgi:hypothetical protein